MKFNCAFFSWCSRHFYAPTRVSIGRNAPWKPPQHGASVVSLIPTRPGNGAMDALLESGEFTPPALDHFEDCVDWSIQLGRGRVFADLWELERFAGCPNCFAERRLRLDRTNREQKFFHECNAAALTIDFMSVDSRFV